MQLHQRKTPYLVHLETSYLLMLVANTLAKKIHHQVTQL